MCGIFGVTVAKNYQGPLAMKEWIDKLFVLSESRGKEASGLMVQSEGEILVYGWLFFEPIGAKC
jgi:glutamine phosphoribosylpyrophosphate amidotransferase